MSSLPQQQHQNVGRFNCMLNPYHLICQLVGFVNLEANQNIWDLK